MAIPIPICLLNHFPWLVSSIATGEIGTRAIVHKDDLGLTTEQVEQLIEHARAWRARYLDLSGELFRLADDMHTELAHHRPDVSRLDEAAEARGRIFTTMEKEFSRVWASVAEVLTEEQHRALVEIYFKELGQYPVPLAHAYYAASVVET